MEYTHTENLLRLLAIAKNLSPDLQHEINANAGNFLEQLGVGTFLMEDLNDEQQTEDDIRTLVQCVPTSLFDCKTIEFPDDYELPYVYHFPDQICVRYLQRASFIPLLAEEGMKHNVGGDGMRGGLLCKDAHKYNVLQGLSTVRRDGFEIEGYDERFLDVFKRLREMDLLKKEDIMEYNLLLCSCYIRCRKRFNYFADWDPAPLKELQIGDEGDLLLHISAFHNYRGTFKLALTATLRHFPEELGLLFVKNNEGSTSFQIANDNFGQTKTWETIEACLNECDEKILEMKNPPTTGMYPFMIAAEGDTSELNMVYYLLRRNPVVLESTCMAKVGLRVVPELKKRKRSGDERRG